MIRKIGIILLLIVSMTVILIGMPKLAPLMPPGLSAILVPQYALQNQQKMLEQQMRILRQEQELSLQQARAEMTRTLQQAQLDQGAVAAFAKKLAQFDQDLTQIHQMNEVSRQDLLRTLSELAMIKASITNIEQANRQPLIGQIKADIEQGRPFDKGLAALAALDHVEFSASVQQSAKTGITPTSALLIQLQALIPVALQEPTVQGGGWLQRLVQGVRGMITVRPTGVIAGQTDLALLSQAQAFLGQGQAKQALERLGLTSAKTQEVMAPVIAPLNAQILALEEVAGGR